MPGSKDGGYKRINPSDHTNHNNGSYHQPKGDSSHFIQKAIKHPGAEKAAAKSAGMSTHAYMEQHKSDAGTAGKRARLGLTLEGMHHPKPSAPAGDSDGDADDQKPVSSPMGKGCVTVAKPVKMNNPTNKPASANAEPKGPKVAPGQPINVTGVYEASGSKSLDAEPLASKPKTSNQKK